MNDLAGRSRRQERIRELSLEIESSAFRAKILSTLQSADRGVRFVTTTEALGWTQSFGDAYRQALDGGE